MTFQAFLLTCDNVSEPYFFVQLQNPTYYIDRYTSALCSSIRLFCTHINVWYGPMPLFDLSVFSKKVIPRSFRIFCRRENKLLNASILRDCRCIISKAIIYQPNYVYFWLALKFEYQVSHSRIREYDKNHCLVPWLGHLFISD